MQTTSDTPETPQQIASRVRKEKAKLTNIGPNGLCFDWNLDLAHALVTAGHLPQFVYGQVLTKKGPKTHYWVQLDSQIIDITGDQFNPILTVKMPQIHFQSVGLPYNPLEDQSYRIYKSFKPVLPYTPIEIPPKN